MSRLAVALVALCTLIAIALTGIQPAGAEQSAPPARKASFDDRDPVDFGRFGPRKLPVHGIDVARFQGDINWRKARRAGVNFAFIKATEGGDLLDPAFRDNWRGAARAGVLRGAYHFYYFCTSATKQAKWFIRNVPRAKGALPPVLDMEWNPYSPTCKKRPPAQDVRRSMKTFLNRVERHFGQRPIIYTTPKFYRENRLDRLTGEEFWLRAVAKTPDQIYPGQGYSFWQYSGTGIIDGIDGDVDLNAFAGTRKTWTEWLARRRQ